MSREIRERRSDSRDVQSSDVHVHSTGWAGRVRCASSQSETKRRNSPRRRRRVRERSQALPIGPRSIWRHGGLVCLWPPSPLSISAARALLIGLSRAVFLPRFGPMPAELRDNADCRLLAGARVAGQASRRSRLGGRSEKWLRRCRRVLN